MGKIKQGILGGFKGKVGTVIGASWNGIAYMRGLPQSIKNPKTAAQQAQRAFFAEVQDLVGQLTYEQLRFLFPNPEKEMSRRNAMVKQLAALPVVEEGTKHVDLANLGTIGNAPTADLPDVTVTASRSSLNITWNKENDWRTAHADEYPTIFVANVTRTKIFLVHSTVVIGASACAVRQSFSLSHVMLRLEREAVMVTSGNSAVGALPMVVRLAKLTCMAPFSTTLAAESCCTRAFRRDMPLAELGNRKTSCS